MSLNAEEREIVKLFYCTNRTDTIGQLQRALPKAEGSIMTELLQRTVNRLKAMTDADYAAEAIAR